MKCIKSWKPIGPIGPIGSKTITSPTDVYFCVTCYFLDEPSGKPVTACQSTIIDEGRMRSTMTYSPSTWNTTVQRWFMMESVRASGWMRLAVW